MPTGSFRNNIILMLLMTALNFVVHAQNLVPNYSFEVLSSCPENWGGSGATLAPPWLAPTAGTPDIYNICAAGTVVDVPENLLGTQNPLTGDGYAGIFTYINSYEYREYMTAPLLQQLVAGMWYHVSFYVSPAEDGCTVAEIGAYISRAIPYEFTVGSLYLVPQIESAQGLLNDFDGWTLISGCFQANGLEAYITIGNFRSDDEISVDPLCNSNFAYYYVENVSLIPAEQNEEFPLELGDPISVCYDYEIDPDLPGDFYYSWSDGSHGPTLTVTESGVYVLTVTDGECNYAIDSIEITIFSTLDPVDIGPPEVTLCSGETYTILLDPALSEYTWQDGSNNSEYTITTSGIYSVTLDDGCTSTSDEIELIFIDPPPLPNLGEDQELCSQDVWIISLDPSFGQYVWQDGSNATLYTISEPGIYSVTVTNMCGTNSNEIIVTEIPVPTVDLGPGSDIVCEGETLLIELDPTLGEFLWHDGSTDPTYLISSEGLYAVTVTNQCGEGSDDILIEYLNPPIVSLGDDITLCENTTLELIADPTQGSPTWQDNSTGNTFLVQSPGTYSLTIENECGEATDEIVIEYLDDVQPPDLGLDLNLCPGETITLYANSPGPNFSWQDGSTQDFFIANGSGTYYVEVFNACSFLADTIIITSFNDPPAIDLPDQLVLCQGSSLVLDAGITGVEYVWNDQSVGQQHIVSTAGVYSLTVSNSCGFDADTVVILDGGLAPGVSLGNDIEICPGQSIAIMPVFSNTNTWLWHDGSSLPSYTVTTQGVFYIDAFNDCGVASDTIQVSMLPDIPILDLGSDTSLCGWQTITLSNPFPEIGIVWSDGSTQQQIIAQGAGTFFGTITNSCGQSSDTVVINALIDIPPLNLGPDQSICAGELITLSPGIPEVDYLWHDGTTNSTYGTTQAEIISLTITNSCGSSSDTIELNLSTQGPDLDLGPDIDVCEGETVIIPSGLLGVQYLWQDGSMNPDFITSQAGEFILQVSNNCGTDTDTILVDISGTAPVVDLGPDIQVCEGEVVTILSGIFGVNYVWQDGSADPDFTTAQSGVFYLDISNNCGSASDTIAVDISGVPPTPDLGDDITLCEGIPLILTSTADDETSIEWQDGSSAPTFSVTSSGTYILHETNRCGEAADTLIAVILNAPAPFSLGPDTTLCPGESFTLIVPSTAYEILWHDGTDVMQYFVDQPGTYSLQLSNDCGIVTDDIVVNYSSHIPQLDLDPTISWCDGDIISLDATQAFEAEYLWSTGSTSSSIEVSSTGQYSVEVITECNTVSQNVEVVPGSDCVLSEYHKGIGIPNIFSPNGDGVNDEFVLTFGSDLNLLSLRGNIYDRWGNLVYQSDASSFVWDGYFGDKPAMTGVYLYTIMVRYLEGTIEREKMLVGDVTLLR